jgi:hypothetical protein
MKLTEQEIIDGNILIADFINLNDGNWRNQVVIDNFNGKTIPRENTLAYHKSFDCLMPVVEKIEKTKIDRMKFTIIIHIHKEAFCRIESKGKSFRNSIYYYDNLTLVIWATVIEFIKFYNERCNITHT